MEKNEVESSILLNDSVQLNSSNPELEDKHHIRSLFQYHLELTEVASFDESFSQKSPSNEIGLYIDEGRQEMFTYKLVGSKYNVSRIPYHGEKPTNNGGNNYAISNGLVDDIKMSKDCSHISIRRGGSIEMLSLVGGYSINYRVPAEGLLLRYFWPLPSILLVICTCGFEIVKPSSRILIVSTSKKPSILQAFNILRDVNDPLITMPPFDIFPKGEIPNGRLCRPEDIIISKIYNGIYCIYTDLKEGKIRFWKLSIHDVSVRHEIEIIASGEVALSVIDNLLIVHCLNEKVSMIYDILMEDLHRPDNNSNQTVNRVLFPIAAPLPMTPFFRARNENDKVVHLKDIYENWTFVLPDFIFSRNECKMWKISINLKDIIKDVLPQQLFHFLRRRRKSKQLILEVIRKFIKNKEDIRELHSIFLTLAVSLKEFLDRFPENYAELFEAQKVYSKMKAHEYYFKYLTDHGYLPLDSALENQKGEILKESREFVFKGKQIITQEEFFVFVIQEFSNQYDVTKPPYAKYFASITLEYIQCLYEAKLIINPIIFEFLIKLLLSSGKSYQCYQLIQYKIISDSLYIAFLLLSFEKDYPQTFQIGVDMLKRLNHPKQIIKVLLAKERVIDALWYTSKYRYEVMIKAENYLDIAMKKGDVIEFFNCFNYFTKTQNSTVNNKIYLDYYSECFQISEKEILV